MRARAAQALAAGGTPRRDDDPEVLGHRIETYLAKTRPVSDHYEATGRLVAVDGMAAVDAVEASIHAVLDGLRAGSTFLAP